MTFLRFFRFPFLLVLLMFCWGAAAETLSGKVVRVVDGARWCFLPSGTYRSGFDFPGLIALSAVSRSASARKRHSWTASGERLSPSNGTSATGGSRSSGK